MVIRGLRNRVAAVVGVVTFLLLAGTGTATAFWTANQQTVTGSATTANLDLAVTGDLTTTYSFGGTGSGATTPAGASVLVREAVITNPSSSTVNLAVQLTATRAASSTLAAADVAFWMFAKSGATCTASSAASTTLASPVTFTGGTLAPGASQSVCVQTRLNTTVAASAGKNITITLDALGTLSGTSWSAAAAVASTQTVFSVTKPVVVCDNENNGDYGLNLTWPMQAGVTYDVLRSNGTVVKANAQSGDTFTVQSGNNVGTGVAYLTVRATSTVTGQQVNSSNIVIRYESVLFFFSTIRCNPEGTFS